MIEKGRLRCISIAVTTAILVGCKSKPAALPAPHSAMKPMAVVDTDEVVATMGWSHDIQYAMDSAHQKSQAILSQRYAELSEQLANARQKVVRTRLTPAQLLQLQGAQSLQDIADLPITDSERLQIIRLTEDSNQAAMDAKEKSQKDMDAIQANLLASFRNLVASVAKRIASRDGYRMVLADGPDIVFHEPSADITPQVIAELKNDQAPAADPDGK
jgi:Skp family chaperone for outer membrane proteins